MATLEDVASAAGVAVTTVSRALRNDATLKITPDTRKRIFSAAEQVGYEQKRQKILQARKNIVIVHKDTHFDNQMDNAYYFSMRTGQEAACMERGLDYRYVPYSMLRHHVEACDGAVIMGNFSREEVEFIAKAVRTQQIVFTGLMNFCPERMDWVTYDVCGAVELMAGCLAEQGVRTVVYFGGEETPGILPRYSKRRVFFSLAEAGGLVCRESVYGAHGAENGCRMMLQWLDKGEPLPDAFAASNDPIAIGMLKALAQRGIRVPEDVSVISINGDSPGEFMNPPLTTVDVQTKRLGAETIYALLDQMETGRTYYKKIEFAPRLLMRGSVRSV